jgi:iron complex outermembrane receptor protein
MTKANRIFSILTGFLFFFTALMPNVSAQDKEVKQDIFQLSLEELGQVVVTPSKLPQSAGNVTQKIDVVDSKEIETTVSGNRNLCEAIAKLPGVSVSVLSRNDANWGTYGGIGPKYSTYMLQGLPLDAFVDPMSLDLNAIDHIEVQRGPASVFYPNYLSQDFAGNQSPLAGTVNLILKQKIARPLTLFQTSYGSYNTLNGQIFQQNRMGRFNYFCGSTYEMSDYTNYGVDGSWLNMRKNPEYEKTKVYGGVTLFMDENEKHKLTLFGQETWHNGDAGRVYRGFDNNYGTVNAGYDVSISNRLHLQSHLGIRSYDRAWQDSKAGAVGIDTLTGNNGVNQMIIPADISFSWQHGEAGLLSVGADYQEARYYTWSDLLVGYRSYGNKSSAMQGGVYVQEDFRLFKKLTLRGGLRYAYVKNLIETIDGVTPGDNSAKWSNVLWSAGARYAITDNIAVYANSGSSFLTPGLKSSGGTLRSSDRGVAGQDGQLPNPDLKPERGIGSDAGVDFRLPAQIKAGVRGFYINVDDAIVDNVVSQNPSQTQSVNAGSSRSAGGEIEVSQKITTTVSWFANGTYMTTNIKNDLDINENNVEIPFSPNIIANVGVSYCPPFGLSLTPSLNYTGGFYDGTVKTGRGFFTPGVVLNVYAAQVLVKGGSYTVECFTQLYNITNNKFDLPWQFKNPGFSGMAGIKVTF